jgi:hypothetical protein
VKKFQIVRGLAAFALLSASAIASATQVYMIQDALRSASFGSVSTLRFDGSATGTIASDATWDWNAGTGVLTQTGGTLRTTRTSGSTAAGTKLYTDVVTGLIINTVADTTTATTYNCVEGGFGAVTSGNTCGNYSWGFNAAEESTLLYNVGGDANCTNVITGGDDTAPSTGPLPTNGGLRGLAEHGATAGCLAQVGARDMIHVFSDTTGIGGTVTLWNAINGVSGVPLTCVGAGAANVACNGTHWMTFSAVPVPGAVWLFGSAMGLLGLARRRRQQL